MQTLRVYPNPWAAFDRNGVPCGICSRDPEADAGGGGKFVGARIDAKNTKILDDFAKAYAAKFGAALAAKLAEQEHRSPRQATFYEYMGVPSQDPALAEKLAAKEPIEIPATKYYKDRIREGALIPADAQTAQKSHAPFVAPAAYFAARSLLPSGVTLPADGVARTVEIEPGAPALSSGVSLGGFEPPAADSRPIPDVATADAESAKSPKTKKPNQEPTK